MRVTVWSENIKDKSDAKVKSVYPEGMHNCLANAISQDETLICNVRTLDQDDQGLGPDVLANTDVLVFWAHNAHDRLSDSFVDGVRRRVLQGMGLIVLHSAHASPVLSSLLGTSCSLTWREESERQRIWVCEPSHPIAQGLGDGFVIEHEETYAEPFGIPRPDDVVFLGWSEGGEAFRSGVTFTRGAGKIFYFSPGHETHPTFRQPEIGRVLRNACHWAAPVTPYTRDPFSSPNRPIAPESEGA